MWCYEHGGEAYADAAVSLDFSVNINPLGMPAAARDAIVAHMHEYERYPDPFCRDLRAAIAGRCGVPPATVLCGNGASELILALCSCLRPRQALTLAPTFSEYRRSVELFGGALRAHELAEADGFALTEALLDKLTAPTDVLFLCNPNNPTGRLADPGLLVRIADACVERDITLVLDECFIDFTQGHSMLKSLGAYPNLVVLQAFTKSHAMAGLRLGMLFCSNERLVSDVARHMPTWSVSRVAQVAAVAALGEEGWLEKTRSLVKRERDYMAQALQGLGLAVCPSDANFLLLRSDRPLYEPLKEQGILVRRCANFCGLDDSYVRIGLKTRRENARLVEAVASLLDGSNLSSRP
ncbi:MAG: aminotransferase class I/II-fold pyridoxal phosphate-dependent enzyme [Coriobacteriales bacterium]|nr:aminotransferase class I/II-fold pyridoxal phosphate-dependent enzyme [Coriobacteriales bacterium]